MTRPKCILHGMGGRKLGGDIRFPAQPKLGCRSRSRQLQPSEFLSIGECSVKHVAHCANVAQLVKQPRHEKLF